MPSTEIPSCVPILKSSINRKTFFGLEFDVGESVFGTYDMLHAARPNRRRMLAISE